MDDFTLQQELEALAGNAYNPDLDDSHNEPISDTIARWTKLFKLSQDEAVDRIMDHRNDLTRPRISSAHWNMICAEKEAEGYDQEAYEYELGLQKKKATLTDVLSCADSADSSTVTFLIEMDDKLDNPQKVRKAAGMNDTPAVVSGRSIEEGRPVRLCCIDGRAKTTLLRWAADDGGGYEPTILVDPRSMR